MPNVQMPNGDIVGFPDDMSPEDIKGLITTKFPDVVKPKSTIEENTPSPFGSNRGVTPPTAKDPEDFAKSITAGAEAAPFWLNDTVKGVEQGITRLSGATYEALGGELTPEQAKMLTEPYSPVSTSKEIYEKAGEPLYEPKTSLGVMGNLMGNAASMSGFKPISEIRAAIKSRLPQKVNDFLADESSGATNVPAQRPEGFEALAEANKNTGMFARENDPSVAGLTANQGISKAYHKANTKAEELYSVQKNLGEGETTTANDISEPLSKTIADLEQSTITPQQSSTLRRLKAIQEKYFTSPDTGETVSGMSVAGETVAPKAKEIEFNDLVELKQALNEGFKSNDFTKSSDIPLVKLNNAIKGKINSLKDTHPDFVQAGKTADEFYGNEVARKFKDNSELDTLWQPEDYYAWKETIENPNARGHTDATLTRAGKFLDSLNSGDEGRVSALINALPKEDAVQLLHDAILHAKKVTPSLRNVALNLLGKSGTHGTVGTPVYSAEQALRNLIGAVVPGMGKESPLLNLTNRVTPTENKFPLKAAGVAGLSYLGEKSFGSVNENKIPEKGAINVKPQSNSNPIGATNAALTSSKKNDYDFSLSDLNPISEAEAGEIKVPENSPISGNVATFKSQDKGALQNAMKKHGVSPTEMMTLINAESSVQKLTGNGYAQMTPPAWKQSETILGRKLNRSNPNDYAEAATAYYKWTADQVKKITGSAGTPSIKDVYPAYNAGIGGFKALIQANSSEKAVNVVPKDVSSNNKHFYYSKTGAPLTVKQTLNEYKKYISTKMDEYSPTTSSKSTKLALNQARLSSEDDMDPTER